MRRVENGMFSWVFVKSMYLDWPEREPFRDIGGALERRFARCPCVVRTQGPTCCWSDLGCNLGSRGVPSSYPVPEGTENRRLCKRLPSGRLHVLRPER